MNLKQIKEEITNHIKTSLLNNSLIDTNSIIEEYQTNYKIDIEDLVNEVIEGLTTKLYEQIKPQLATAVNTKYEVLETLEIALQDNSNAIYVSDGHEDMEIKLNLMSIFEEE